MFFLSDENILNNLTFKLICCFESSLSDLLFLNCWNKFNIFNVFFYNFFFSLISNQVYSLLNEISLRRPEKKNYHFSKSIFLFVLWDWMWGRFNKIIWPCTYFVFTRPLVRFRFVEWFFESREMQLSFEVEGYEESFRGRLCVIWALVSFLFCHHSKYFLFCHHSKLTNSCLTPERN